MNCKEFSRKAGMFIDNELQVPETAACEEHIGTCDACRTLAAQIRGTGNDLQVFLAAIPDRGPARIRDVMAIISALPVPVGLREERSLFFKIAYTLYTAAILGIMSSVTYIVLFSNFFGFEQVLHMPEARTAFFGSLCVMIGCAFLLGQGREVNIWLTARVHMGAAVRMAADNVMMVAAGAGFCVCGGILFLVGMF